MKITPFAILFLCLLLLGKGAQADHIVGGELLYNHLSGNIYKVSLALYGECSGGSFSHLKIGKPRIAILNEQGQYYTLILNEEISLRAEVTNVCPQQANNTTCVTPQGTVPGITRFVYTNTIELDPANNWRFLFSGHLDSSGKSQTGLSTYISNIKNNTGLTPHLYLEATLNNADAPNSNPVYTVPPVPRYCLYQPQQYNQGAVDADGDALHFSLIPPLDLNALKTEYIPPYTATQPFAAQQGSFYYNNINGQMSFIPVKTEVAFVVNKVEEYRNGKLVGSSMRGITLFMAGSCGNTAPLGNIDAATASGGIVNDNAINLCEGEGKIRFSIPVYDNDGDDIHVTLSNIPNTALAQVVNNNTTAPAITFEWEMNNVSAGNYTFYAQYNDGVCPIPGMQVIAYTIRVVKPFRIDEEVLVPTNCAYKQKSLFHVAGGILPYKVKITGSGNAVISEYAADTASFADSFKTGGYKLIVYADYVPCSTEYNFEVIDRGVYPFAPQVEDIHQCLNETPVNLNPAAAHAGTVQWFDMDGTRLSAAPVYNTDSIKHFSWLLNQKVKVCESVFDTMDVYVHENPDIVISTKGGHACMGDGVFLLATGGIKYEWEPADKITMYDDVPYTYVHEPQVYVVTGYSEYNCSATDSLVFDDIEQCCLFSYPNAFSPNGDGINDGWHPITYGNVDFYLLSVYDRWGERIFTTSDPKQKWDGSFMHKPCAIGTYHYLLRAKCITGQEEQSGGSFVLLR